MAMQPFFWGAGGQKISSPEQAERQRQIALALQNRPAADSWESGLANLTNGLAGMSQENRVAEAEAEGRQRAGGLFADLATNADPNSIIAALTSPDAAWASPSQTSIASALLNSGLDRQDPLYQLKLQQAQAELKKTNTPANPFLNVGNGSVFNQTTGEFMSAPGGSEPTGVQEFNFAVSQGFPGSYLDFINAKRGNGLSITSPDGTVIQQGGPVKALTEGQSKDTVYATRAAGALPIIDNLGTELTNLGTSISGQTPIVGNFTKSPEYQQAEQAGTEFLQAILRKDTGAAITPQETEEYGKVYLPRPGDSPQLLEQKRVSRQRALEAIKAGLPPQAIVAQEKALINSGGDDWSDLGNGVRIRPLGN